MSTEILIETAWICLNLTAWLASKVWLRSKHPLQLKHTFPSCSGALLFCPSLSLLVTFENPTEACSVTATGTFVAKWPLCVLLVLAVIHYCFQEVSVNLSGVYWLLRFLLAAPSYILVLVPLFSNSSAIRPNSATTENVRKKKNESILKLVFSKRVSEVIENSWAGTCW